MPRRTKIIATLGPASRESEVLEHLFVAGVDVVRINFSHTSGEEALALVAKVRQAAQVVERHIGILMDLQGPKIRIGTFKNRQIELKAGDVFILDVACSEGDETKVGIDYADLPKDVVPGDMLLLDDGRITLKVKEVVGSAIDTEVVTGGVLSSHKGINKKGGGLSAGALTEKDKEDIKIAALAKADFLGVSFVKNGKDLQEVSRLLHAAKGHALLVAKIERTEAVNALDEIMKACDCLMVARGDLGVEIGFASVPAIQKRIIRESLKNKKIVITATQMMESMITENIPTRAEVSDVANAVLDGTDAVMLSAETAVGRHPITVVQTMAQICTEAEEEANRLLPPSGADLSVANTEDAIATAAQFSSRHLPVKAIAALTLSGRTPFLMTRLPPLVPIYALTPSERTCGRMSLVRGVYPIKFSHSPRDSDVLLSRAEEQLLDQGAVERGDLMILTIGEPIGVAGHTNTMKIIQVGEHENPAAMTT
jgi:pyruvate kinase